jgi:phosphoribosyl 1,2-cyclic phosphate phosphodiesterase
MSTRITFLGTGTSQGVPLIACPCRVCRSTDPLNKRLRSSIKIESGGKVIVIDSGPDFRQQMLRTETGQLDALIFTHEHKDHIAGMDDIRAFNYIHQTPIDVYATAHVQTALRREYQYIFSDFKYPGIPEINLHTIENGKDILIEEIRITPIEVLHYKLPVLGFRVNDFTYITDANFISEQEKEKIKGSKVMVLNALRKEKHISHYTLEEAIALVQELEVPEAYFTHISHQLGLHHEVEATLPEGMHLAYDGLEVVLEDREG